MEFCVCVEMNVLMHIKILELILGTQPFHSPTLLLSHCTISLPSLWLLCIYLLVLLSGVGPALFLNILPHDNQLPRWNQLEDCHASIALGFFLRFGIHKAPYFLLCHCVIFALLVKVYIFLSYPCEDVLIVRFSIDILFLHRLLWDYGYLHHDVLCSIHLIVWVKIFYLHAHVSWFDVWYGDFSMEFHDGYVWYWSSGFSWIIYNISSCSESCSVILFFLWYDIT